VSGHDGHCVRLAYNNCSTVIGNDLMRRPVAWYTALAMAADTPTTPISVSTNNTTVKFIATDVAGNTRNKDLSFTLLTKPPSTPSFDLAATDVFGSPSDHATQSSSVTLVGQADPNVGVTLVGSGVTTVASNTGKLT